MKPERAYFSLLTCTWSVAANSNFGLSNFLYPYGDDKLTTFMSSHVDQNEFLDALPNSLQMSSDISTNLLGLGFRMFGGFFSFDLSLHSSVNLSLPKGLFEFAKRGLQGEHYSFSGLNINTTNYAAASIGYSHKIFDGFQLGVNAKYLLGLAHADVFVDKLDVELSGQRWMVESHAQAQAALLCGADVEVDENNVIKSLELALEEEDLRQLRASDGFAVDLGFVYDLEKFVPGLKVSASVVDLGYINWRYMLSGQSTDAKVEFDGFGEVDVNDVEGSVNAELEKLADDAAKLMAFNYDGESSVKARLNTTMHIGAEYNMPFYKPLSVGVLYSQCFSPYESRKWLEARGYVNVSPVSWFEISANYGYGTYGHSLGWMLNFHPAGINLFVGSDYMITKVSPQYIPLNSMNAHVTFGLSLAFGKRK
jgi:hypothetical protein